MSKSQSECKARCPAAGSIANALSKAGYVLSSEFRLSNTVSFSRERDTTCALVERRWKSFCVSQRLTIRKERTRLRFDMAVKGCKRLFDKPCKRCDVERSSVAVQSWISKMEKSHDFEVSPGLLTWIRDETRVIVRGWGRKLADARHALDVNPGHEGCREMATGLGGGLATPRFGLIGDPAKCRLGYCKTKGKFRVVTMQSVYVKEKIRPLHNALYDHLSKEDWLVRGDVSFSDFKSVSAGGHSIISGDYEGATDNIHHSAVMAIIDVLCEEERLTKKEVHILRESFRTPWWVSCAFGKGNIMRGSMMGNLVSFPLLCILNRVCHVISMKRSRWSGPTVGRFNGDDCMFPGDKALYDEWRRTTGEVGLIVNEDKTMFSSRFCELNSQAFDIKTNQLISKTSLNFFGLPRDSPGEILTSVLDGIKGLKIGLQLEIVNRMMRYEISVRGVSLSNISTFWQRQLIKRKWFRTLLSYGSAPKVADHPESTYFPGQPLDRKMYSERKFEVVRGPLPKDEYVPICDEISRDLERYHLEVWRGISRIPITYKHDRIAHKESLKGLKPNRDVTFTSIKETWCYLWPRILLDIVQDQFPDILREGDVYTRTLVANSNRISPQYSLSFHRKYRWFQPPTELVTPSYFSRNTDGGVKL